MTDTITTERFWSKVYVAGPGECWEWAAGKGSHGYGVFYPSTGVQITAHRFALSTVERAPARAHALHSCDNKGCVNPAHLRWGSHADNMRDAADRGLMFAPNANKSHCPHGHELTAENTIWKTKRHNGRSYQSRNCRECNRIYLANRRQKRSAA